MTNPSAGYTQDGLDPGLTSIEVMAVSTKITVREAHAAKTNKTTLAQSVTKITMLFRGKGISFIHSITVSQIKKSLIKFISVTNLQSIALGKKMQKFLAFIQSEFVALVTLFISGIKHLQNAITLAQAQTTNLIRANNKIFSFVQTQITNLFERILAKNITIVQSQITNLSKAINKIFAVILAQTTTLFRSINKMIYLVQTQTFITTQNISKTFSLLYTQAINLTKAVNKSFMVALVQSLGIRRVVNKVFSWGQTQITFMTRVVGKILSLGQSQLINLTRTAQKPFVFLQAQTILLKRASQQVLPFIQGQIVNLKRTTNKGLFVFLNLVGKQNLFISDLANAFWATNANATLSANITTAPDGTVTGAKLKDNTTIGVLTHDLAATLYTYIPGDAYTFMIYAQAAEYTRIAFVIFDTDIGNEIDVAFDLAGGQVGTPTITNRIPSWNTQASILTDSLATGSGGNGWYRCVVTIQTPYYPHNPGVQLSVNLYLDNGAGTSTVQTLYNSSGNNIKGIALWGPQFTQGWNNIAPYVSAPLSPIPNSIIFIKQAMPRAFIFIQGQILSVIVVHGAGKVLSLVQSQTISIARAMNKTIAFIQTQAINFIRSMSKSITFSIQTQIIDLKRPINKMLSFIQTQTTNLSRAVLKPFIIVQAQTINLSRGMNKLFTLIQTQFVDTTNANQKAIGFIQNQITNLGRAFNKPLSFIQTQFVDTTNANQKIFKFVQAQIITLTRPVIRNKLITFLSTQTTNLRRSILKVLILAQNQLVNTRNAIKKTISYGQTQMAILTKSFNRTFTFVMSLIFNIVVFHPPGKTYQQINPATLNLIISQGKSLSKFIVLISNQTILVAKNITRTITSILQIQTVNLIKNISKPFSFGQTQTTNLTRAMKKFIALSQTQIINFTRLLGKTLLLGQAQIIKLIRSFNRIFSFLQNQTVKLTRIQGIIRIFTLIQAQTTILGRAFRKPFSFGQAQSFKLGRAINKPFSIAQIQVIKVSKMFAKTITFTSTQIIRFFKSANKKFSFVQAQIFGFFRHHAKNIIRVELLGSAMNLGKNYVIRHTHPLISLSNFVRISVYKAFTTTQTQTVMVARRTVHHISTMTFGQIVKLLQSHAFNKIVSFTQAQVTSMRRAIGHIMNPKIIISQAINSIKFNSRRLTLLTIAETTNLIRRPQKVFKLIQAPTFVLIKSVTHPIQVIIPRIVTSLSKIIGHFIASSHGIRIFVSRGNRKLNNLFQTQVVNAKRLTGHALTLVMPQVTNLRRASQYLIKIIFPQTVRVTRTIGHLMNIITGQSAKLVRTISRHINLTEAQAILLVMHKTYIHYLTTTTAQITRLLRVPGKILSPFLGQSHTIVKFIHRQIIVLIVPVFKPVKRISKAIPKFLLSQTTRMIPQLAHPRLMILGLAQSVSLVFKPYFLPGKFKAFFHRTSAQFKGKTITGIDAIKSKYIRK